MTSLVGPVSRLDLQCSCIHFFLLQLQLLEVPLFSLATAENGRMFNCALSCVRFGSLSAKSDSIVHWENLFLMWYVKATCVVASIWDFEMIKRIRCLDQLRPTARYWAIPIQCLLYILRNVLNFSFFTQNRGRNIPADLNNYHRFRLFLFCYSLILTSLGGSDMLLERL